MVDKYPSNKTVVLQAQNEGVCISKERWMAPIDVVTLIQ